MRIYFSYFKIRFVSGLQYRSAALAGMITQVVWGILSITFLNIFNTNVMSHDNLSTYIWLNQAFLAITAIWATDTSIFDLIENGDVALEALRPINLYSLWFIRNLAYRISRCLLRFAPVIITAFLLPSPYKMSLPSSPLVFIYFLISLVLTLLIVVAITMWMAIFTIHIKTSLGIRTLFMAIFDLFSGTNIPLIFFPSWLQRILSFTFFIGLQTATFNIYLGLANPLSTLALQLVWAVILIGSGYFAMQHALKHLEIVGG